MYKNILVPLDGSKLAECVLPHLEIIASGCGAENLLFLRVVRPFVPMADLMGNTVSSVDVTAINNEAVKAAEDYIKKIAADTKYLKIKTQWEVIRGGEAESVIDYAKSKGVDLIIIATHGRSGVSRWVMGSVADRVMRSACVPVMMIRPPGCIPGF